VCHCIREDHDGGSNNNDIKKKKRGWVWDKILLFVRVSYENATIVTWYKKKLLFCDENVVREREVFEVLYVVEENTEIENEYCFTP